MLTCCRFSGEYAGGRACYLPTRPGDAEIRGGRSSDHGYLPATTKTAGQTARYRPEPLKWLAVWIVLGAAAAGSLALVLTNDKPIDFDKSAAQVVVGNNDPIEPIGVDGMIAESGIEAGPQEELGGGGRRVLPTSTHAGEGSVELDSGLGPGAATIDTLGSVEVTFELAEGSAITSRATLLLAGDRPGLDVGITWKAHENSRRTHLAPGTYSAAIRTSDGYGTVANFDVTELDVSVELDAPRLFDLRLGVIDTATSRAVPGAKAMCTRIDLTEGWPAGGSFHATTGPDGLAIFEGLAHGEWEISVQKEGYETGRFETPLPGPWEPHIEAYGLVDMQDFGIAPMRTLSLQLIGAGDEELSLYSANHSSVTPPIAFDSDGQLDLLLGSFTRPLFLYVVHPDGQQSAMNLLGELPPEGEALKVSVGGAGTLEVDLRVSRSVRDEIGGSDCFVRVFFETSSGDTRRIRQEAPDDGLFEFHGIQGQHATVCFHVEADSGRSDWVIQEIDLGADRIARTTLSVESPPHRLQFTDAAGTPIAGLWTELYVLPYESTWHRGNLTDEAGMTTAPRIEDGQIAYYAAKDENAIFAVDVLLPELQPGKDTQVKQLGAEPTFVEVTLDGRPAPEAYVEILGARSGRSVDASYTGPQGRSRSNGLTPGSSAEFRVILPGAWWGQDSAVLRPGFNRADLRSMGILRAGSEKVLEAVLDLRSGSSVGQWSTAGLVRLQLSGSGDFAVDVPVGSYRIDTGLPTERTVTVAAGSVVRIGTGSMRQSKTAK